jgi:hypothetical protein
MKTVSRFKHVGPKQSSNFVIHAGRDSEELREDLEAEKRSSTGMEKRDFESIDAQAEAPGAGDEPKEMKDTLN